MKVTPSPSSQEPNQNIDNGSFGKFRVEEGEKSNLSSSSKASTATKFEARTIKSSSSEAINHPVNQILIKIKKYDLTPDQPEKNYSGGYPQLANDIIELGNFLNSEDIRNLAPKLIDEMNELVVSLVNYETANFIGDQDKLLAIRTNALWLADQMRHKYIFKDNFKTELLGQEQENQILNIKPIQTKGPIGDLLLNNFTSIATLWQIPRMVTARDNIILNKKLVHTKTQVENLKIALKSQSEQQEIKKNELLKHFQKEQSALKKKLLIDKEKTQSENIHNKEKSEKLFSKLEQENKSLKEQLNQAINEAEKTSLNLVKAQNQYNQFNKELNLTFKHQISELENQLSETKKTLINLEEEKQLQANQQKTKIVELEEQISEGKTKLTQFAKKEEAKEEEEEKLLQLVSELEIKNAELEKQLDQYQNKKLPEKLQLEFKAPVVKAIEYVTNKSEVSKYNPRKIAIHNQLIEMVTSKTVSRNEQLKEMEQLRKLVQKLETKRNETINVRTIQWELNLLQTEFEQLEKQAIAVIFDDQTINEVYHDFLFKLKPIIQAYIKSLQTYKGDSAPNIIDEIKKINPETS